MDNTQRFSDRAEYYLHYRARYSPAAEELLGERLGLSADSIVADIGSGTGHSALLFLPRAKLVYGVEPNENMRRAAERELRGYPNFKSVPGVAEETTLPDRVADFVAAGSAFHWFDRRRSLEEFKRILKADGRLVVLANHVRRDASPFMRAYGGIFERYRERRERPNLKSALAAVFGDGGLSSVALDNSELLDFARLRGRVLSYSSMPLSGHAQHEPMLADLGRVFDEHQSGGFVPFLAETVIYWGKL